MWPSDKKPPPENHADWVQLTTETITQALKQLEAATGQSVANLELQKIDVTSLSSVGRQWKKCVVISLMEKEGW